MTKEQEYLISLLAAYISGEKIILQPDTDFRQLFATAKIHNLACPVFCAISGAENANVINKNLFAKYKKRYSPYGSVASLYLWEISLGR